MLNIASEELAVIAFHADPAAIDGFDPGKTTLVRVARDEAWLIGGRPERAELAALVRSRFGKDALVVDQSDGWAVWSVEGDRALESLRRLMAAPIPFERPAFVQGAIAGVAGKVYLRSDALFIMVPAPVGHHLGQRLLETCGDLLEQAPVEKGAAHHA